MKSYICNSCGAELILNDNSTFASCLYCGNNIAVVQKEYSDLNIKKIIPFTLEKDEVIKKYSRGLGNQIYEAKKVYVPVRFCNYEFDYLLYYEYVVRDSDDNDSYHDEQDLFDGKVDKEIIFGKSKIRNIDSKEAFEDQERLNFDPVLLNDVSIEYTSFDDADDIKPSLETKVREFCLRRIHREITRIYSENYFVSSIKLENYTTLLPVYVLKSTKGRIITVPGVNHKIKRNFSWNGMGKLIIFILCLALFIYSYFIKDTAFLMHIVLLILFIYIILKRKNSIENKFNNYTYSKYNLGANRKRLKYDNLRR